MSKEKEVETTEVESYDWEAALKAKAAEQSQQRASLSTGPKFISFKGGQLNIDDVAIPGNKLDVVVLTFIAENTFYKGRYDSTKIQTPVCYAVYNRITDMWPSDQVIEKQSDTCEECPHYQWGSDPSGGRGKACKTRYRIAVIPASVESDIDILGAEMRFANIPVTSVKDFESFSSKCEMLMGRPMFGLTSTLMVVADPKTQFKIHLVPNSLIEHQFLGSILKRVSEAEKGITYDYKAQEDEAIAPKPLKK